MLELVDVDAYYGTSRVLQRVSLSVADGELLFVLGRNGVGKTTLLRTILGLMDRASGSIRLDGADLTRSRTDQRAKAGLGYVPQGRGILPRFSVLENLRLGLFANKHPSRGVEEKVLEMFPMLREHARRLGGNLSGGQQQQLAIGRALMTEPTLMLFDEPTEGIQPNIVEEIEGTILKLNRDRGMTMMIVEQNVAFARRAAHRFVILERGSVVADGAPEKLTDELVDRYMAV